MNFKELGLDVASLAIMIICSYSATHAEDSSEILKISNCFNHYLTQMKQMFQEFEISYIKCEKTSYDFIDWSEHDILSQFVSGNAVIKSVCNDMRACQYLKPAEKALECYAKQGAINSLNLKSMSYNASGEFIFKQSTTQSFRSDEYKCTNETSRIYEEKQFEAKNNLYKCIDEMEIATSTEQSNATKIIKASNMTNDSTNT